jgi:hypothetical protein
MPVMLAEGKIFLFVLQIGIFYRSIVVTPLWGTSQQLSGNG